jgi:hypothetical protein
VSDLHWLYSYMQHIEAFGAACWSIARRVLLWLAYNRSSHTLYLSWTGHLLPKDLPLIALDLIERFINGRSFADVPLPSEQVLAYHTRLQVKRVALCSFYMATRVDWHGG